MTLSYREGRPAASSEAVIDWLLESDPSIRWQVMRDLTGAAANAVTAERSRVATEGWGVRLLDQQCPDGQWGDGRATPFWWSNMYTLVFLRDLGVEPASARAQEAIARVRCPVLAIWSRADEWVPIAQSIARWRPSGPLTVVRLPDTTHEPSPRALYERALCPFLDSI